jgi:ABC-type nitrate/sulfonate/bicarbonate transport system permease component
MKVSVTTPIATPKIVSAERSLFALTVATAIAADSLMSSKLINKGAGFWVLGASSEF